MGLSQTSPIPRSPDGDNKEIRGSKKSRIEQTKCNDDVDVEVVVDNDLTVASLAQSNAIQI